MVLVEILSCILTFIAGGGLVSVFLIKEKKKSAKLDNADKIIVSFKLNTQGNTVEIKDSQFIRLNLGAKVKYSNINL